MAGTVRARHKFVTLRYISMGVCADEWVVRYSRPSLGGTFT
jgi:hypothetical protein